MKNGFLYVLFAILLVGAALLYVNKVSPQEFLSDLFSKPYAYKQVEEGVEFVSNDAPLAEILPALANRDSFILSPKMLSTPGELNSFMSQALVQQQIVLAGHGKVTTTVIRVYDKVDGKWEGCQTDYGTARQNEFISVADCTTLLAAPNSVTWGIEFPNDRKPRVRVELEANSISIFPRDMREIPGVNFLVARGMYADAPRLIGVANNLIEDTQSADQNKPKPIDSNILN